MIINRKSNNLSLTYCNMCGNLVGGNGRMEINISFDQEFSKIEGSDINSNISVNICPDCARKFTLGIEENINKVEETMQKARIDFGLQFASSLQNLSITSDSVVPIDCEENNSIIPHENKKVKSREYLEFELKPMEIEQLNETCKKMKGVIKSDYELIDEFNKIGRLKYNLNRMNLEESFEYIRKVIRDNSDYFRLKRFNNKPFIQEIIPMKKENDCEQLNEKTITSSSLSNKRNYTPEEDDFLLENYFKNGINYCMKELNRSYNSVANRMNKLKRKIIGPLIIKQDGVTKRSYF